MNPVYTGRTVWNRSRTDRELADPGNAALGRVEVRRRNTPEQWVISQKRTHPALVSEADFIAVQDLRAARTKAKHEYQLKGLLCCVLCERKFEGHWTNQIAGYRCRHGHTSAMDSSAPRQRNTYLRKDRLLAKLPLLHRWRPAANTQCASPSEQRDTSNSQRHDQKGGAGHARHAVARRPSSRNAFAGR